MTAIGTFRTKPEGSSMGPESEYCGHWPVDPRASREPRPGPSVVCQLARRGFLTLVPVERLAFRSCRRAANEACGGPAQ